MTSSPPSPTPATRPGCSTDSGSPTSRREAGITEQSAGFLIDRLERGGYVERVPDPADGRARLVRRTLADLREITDPWLSARNLVSRRQALNTAAVSRADNLLTTDPGPRVEL